MSRRQFAIPLLILLSLPALSQASEYRREAEWGACELVWTSQEIGRGPFGMVNGFSLPFRAFWGSLADSWMTRLWSPLALGVGGVQGVQQMGAGVLDLVSLGYFHLGPSSTLDSSTPVLVPMRVEAFAREQRPEDCPA